jgi:hypothetical protein
VVEAHDSLFSEGRLMNDERRVVGGAEMGRWLLVAALVVIGVILYFIFAPDSRPVATPSVQEGP